MADINADVIASLKQKQAGEGYSDPVYIATDQRFIKPIRGCSDQIKNLEEQSLIGTDTYTIEDEDGEGNKIIEKLFTKANPMGTDKYYKLRTIKYKNPSRSAGEVDFHFDDTTHELVLPKSGTDIQFKDTSLQCNSNNIFGFSGTTLGIYPNYNVTTQKDTLFFVRGEGAQTQDNILIVSKETQKRYETKTRIITQEIILNRGEG